MKEINPAHVEKILFNMMSESNAEIDKEGFFGRLVVCFEDIFWNTIEIDFGDSLSQFMKLNTAGEVWSDEMA